MKQLLAKLEEIHEKAEYLTQRTQQLVEENRSLKARVDELEQELSGQSEQVAALREENKIVKMARNLEGLGSDAQSEELKRKINEYIREIDRCLKLIGD